MPTYSFACECGARFDRILPMSRYDEPQMCECGLVAQRKVVNPLRFNLPGDGWASKNGRVERQMARKNARLQTSTDEQKREQPGVRLVPNVGGERVDSWQEAQKLASSQGKDAASYDPLVRSEAAKK